MVEYPAGKSLAPVVVTVPLTLDELGAIVTALISYYQTCASMTPDVAWALIQRLTELHGKTVQQRAEHVLYELGK